MVMGNKKLATSKNAGKLLAISIAIRMQWYNAGHISQYSTSRASHEATGGHHQASVCTVLPWRPSWLFNSLKQH